MTAAVPQLVIFTQIMC